MEEKVLFGTCGRDDCEPYGHEEDDRIIFAHPGDFLIDGDEEMIEFAIMAGHGHPGLKAMLSNGSGKTHDKSIPMMRCIEVLIGGKTNRIRDCRDLAAAGIHFNDSGGERFLELDRRWAQINRDGDGSGRWLNESDDLDLETVLEVRRPIDAA